MKKPTVPVSLTERELNALRNLLGHQTHCITLRDKLSAAHKDMLQAKRIANREAKMARKEVAA